MYDVQTKGRRKDGIDLVRSWEAQQCLYQPAPTAAVGADETGAERFGAEGVGRVASCVVLSRV
jgi:hypothetical protein